MKISVIIPTYNEEEHIGQCLLSLKKQTEKNFEIIVVDDESTDQTLKIAKQHADHVLSQPHQGPGAARNLGAKSAKGDILVFVDADMTFHPDFLQKLTAPISDKTIGTFTIEEKVANFDNVLSKLWNYETTGSTTPMRLPENTPTSGPVFRAIVKSEFQKVGGFDLVGYNDDWTLSQKLGVAAQAAKGAVMYHHNPSTFLEVYSQAKWIGGRTYKMGEFGRLIALLRASLPISILKGVLNGIYLRNLSYLTFKIIYDFGISVGIIKYWLGGGNAR